MKRLTYKGKNEKNYVKGNAYYNHCRYRLDEVADRLAAYEETGLEPEEVKTWQEIYNEILTRTYGPFHQKIADYLQAEQEGRMVVLPCKVGDTVFDIFGGSVKEETIVSITFLISQSVKHMTVHAENHRGAITELELLRFGKTWFLTREEAEAALVPDTNVSHTEGGST